MFVTLYGCDRRAKCTILQSTNNPLVRDIGVRLILKKDITERRCQGITLKVNENYEKVNENYEKDPTVLLQTKPTSYVHIIS